MKEKKILTGMFDTHAHLTDSRFNGDRDDIVQSAREEGMEGIICVCSDFEELDVFYTLLEKYDFIYGAVGVHPHDASQYGRLQSKLNEVLAKDKVVAVGEIGLDYYYQNSPRDTQKEAFISQLTLAKQKNMPVIIHTREAIGDTKEILQEKFQGMQGKRQHEAVFKGVMHCFSGEKEDMDFFVNMGLFVSLAGPVTFPKALNLQEIAKFVPAQRLLVETDCPYLAPQPVRGKRNEPCFVKYVIQKISSLRGLSQKELAKISSENAKRLFRIS